MPELTALLASYGHYHRDPRNRRTHYVGVPLIIYAALIPTALARIELAGFSIGLHWILIAALSLFYLCLDLRLGLALAFALALLGWAAQFNIGLGTLPALAWAGLLFILGWVVQIYGHHLEGNRPALLSNILQILIAPIFLMAELGFALGCRPALRAAIDECPPARPPAPGAQ